MKRMDLTQLPEYLSQQRWFGGKAWPIKSVRVIDQATLDAGGAEVVLGILQVSYQVGHAEHYLLPVFEQEGGGFTEAVGSDDFARAMLSLVRTQGRQATGGGALAGTRVQRTEAVWTALSDTPRVRRLGVEQTNTSLVFDEKVIFKLIRKLEGGVNPELEIGRFLAERTGFKGTPALLGGIQLEGSPLDATVAVAHEFVKSSGDGWGHFLQGFRQGPSPSAQLLGDAQQLGKVLGELHTALASVDDDRAFAPEPIEVADLQRWSSSIIGELGVSVQVATAGLPQLASRRDALIERIQRVAQLPPGGKKIRIHGDLHLGQVLRGEKGWLIIDFEGEPSRGFIQRKEKHSPLKDVAGMLRSFEYAEATVELEGAPPGERARAARGSFLAGYFQAVRAARLLPENEQVAQVLLEVLELEKALYEVRYEVAHRPDWVRIPGRKLLGEM